MVLPNAVSDIDGNSYDAVQIGNQVWMAENLRTTKYADGTTIPMGSTYSYAEPYRYAPGSNQSNEENMVNVASYGYLYNRPAVMHGASSSAANPSGVQGICPNGWHVPSDAEWTELSNYMKTQPAYMASGNADHLAKALAATWEWSSASGTDVPGNDPTTNNATGFSALPAGYYGNGGYISFGYYANFWSATENIANYAYDRYLGYSYAYVYRDGGNKYYGFSVRCVRD
ncbi:MAG: fibrobacter succinogenes major paralogous domain-containing protein [Bacteroidales bacterium]|nr:fibrobacter succinogenes major paralogous domain-containing protein [Bacteroidales bacterium]